MVQHGSAGDRSGRDKVLEAMPRYQLEQHLIGFIESHKLGVLATSKDDIPRATPVTTYSEGTTLYILAHPGIKMENIKANSQVSVGICDPSHEWLTVKGIQITGQARFVTDGDADYSHAWRVFQRANVGKKGWEERSRGSTMPVLIVEARKIELLETSLEARGYKISQVWEA